MLYGYVYGLYDPQTGLCHYVGSKQGLPYVREAMRLAGSDRAQHQRLIDRLNETVMAVLSDDEMGLS